MENAIMEQVSREMDDLETNLYALFTLVEEKNDKKKIKKVNDMIHALLKLKKIIRDDGKCNIKNFKEIILDPDELAQVELYKKN